ncbi:MAG TPA: hypothetical protein VKB28_13495 [Solirubrobacteraceae bacterium]|nr:hypothetical protein [Solirubrobacteraceae bacterium]
MNRIRMAAFAVLMVCAVSLGAAGTASAAQQPAETPLTQTVNVTGTKGFKGTLAIDRFAARNGKMVAIGTLKGTMRKNGKTKRVKARTVTLPASVVGAGDGSGAKAAQVPPIPGACQILNLVLGPITLNLLGLVVRTNQINLRIDAVPGAGNLLGNLLCSITNLLNPGGALGPLTTALNQLTAALNALLALVPQSPGTAAAAAVGR